MVSSGTGSDEVVAAFEATSAMLNESGKGMVEGEWQRSSGDVGRIQIRWRRRRWLEERRGPVDRSSVVNVSRVRQRKLGRTSNKVQSARERRFRHKPSARL